MLDLLVKLLQLKDKTKAFLETPAGKVVVALLAVLGVLALIKIVLL